MGPSVDRGARLSNIFTDIWGMEDLRKRVFEPYVTTKAKGTGLGLAIVKKIVEEHHGKVRIRNVDPHGARIEVELPLTGAAIAG